MKQAAPIMKQCDSLHVLDCLHWIKIHFLFFSVMEKEKGKQKGKTLTKERVSGFEETTTKLLLSKSEEC